VIQDSPFEISW